MTSADHGACGSVSSKGSDGGSSCRTFRPTVVTLLLRRLRLLLLLGLCLLLLLGLRLLLSLRRRWGSTPGCRLRLG